LRGTWKLVALKIKKAKNTSVLAWRRERDPSFYQSINTIIYHSVFLCDSHSEREREREMGEVRGGCCPPMDLLRSEPMQLVQLIVPMESAHVTVSYLGDLGLLQFKDVRTISLSLSRSFSICVAIFSVRMNPSLIPNMKISTIEFRLAVMLCC
jgi:hypothetical protein